MTLRTPATSSRPAPRVAGDADRQVSAEAERYDTVAQEAAATVIRAYSSSFGLACHLLKQPVRDRIRNVYAIVRLADEVVDGPLGLYHPEAAATVLDRLEEETAEALADGYSANLVVHAFARTARTCGIGMDLMAPFFASMRADLTVREHDADSFERYVYGSAEVVGLMCLRVFLAELAAPAPPNVRHLTDPGTADPELVEGARRLGAAFQKVNFLRDLAEDYQLRGRRYFPDLDPARLTEADKDRLLDDIDADLAAAAAVIGRLPDSSRPAVLVAHSIFTELSDRLRRTPAAIVRERRCRVPGYRKAWLAGTALLRARAS